MLAQRLNRRGRSCQDLNTGNASIGHSHVCGKVAASSRNRIRDVVKELPRTCIFLAFALSLIATATAAGQLRVGRVEPPPGLGVPFGSIGQPSSAFWSAMFDGLTRLGVGGRLEPALAVSWSNDGARRWVFTLRDDVRFHNGRPLTASAVVAAIDILRSEAGRALYVATEVQGFDSVRALDDRTLEIITREPDPIVPNRLGLVMIVEPATWADIGPAGFARAPVGTGPYQFVAQQGASTRFTAFAESWRPPGDVTELELVAIPDITARMPALLTGRIDVAEGLNGVDIAAAAAEGQVREVRDAPNAVLTMMFRTVGKSASPLIDARVRRAINMAIDKSALAREILDGRMDVASQGIAPGLYGFDPNIAPYSFDPAAAKALLVEAGYPEGFTFRLEIVGAMPWESALYQTIAQDLAAIGIKTELTTMPFPAFLGKLASGQWGDTDGFPLIWDTSVYGDASRILRVASCLKPNPFFCDPSVTPLIERAEREMNTDRRRETLQQAMAATKAAAVGVWLLDFRRFHAVGPRVASLPMRPTGIVYEEVTLDEPAGSP